MKKITIVMAATILVLACMTVGAQQVQVLGDQPQLCSSEDVNHCKKMLVFYAESDHSQYCQGYRKTKYVDDDPIISCNHPANTTKYCLDVCDAANHTQFCLGEKDAYVDGGKKCAEGDLAPYCVGYKDGVVQMVLNAMEEQYAPKAYIFTGCPAASSHSAEYCQGYTDGFKEEVYKQQQQFQQGVHYPSMP
jgi:hypothetical protein